MIEKYRNEYFMLVDQIVHATGNSKRELHEYYKQFIFPFLFENPGNFTADSQAQEYPPYSTRSLSEQGWETFLHEFKHFKIEKFNI